MDLPAPGKIVYTPLPAYGLALDGSHYLTLDSALFNPGAGPFGLDFLARLNCCQNDLEVLIAGKGVNGLAGGRGWQVSADVVNRRYLLRLNDGQAQPLTVYSNNNVFSLDSWDSPYIALRLDRGGQATFFVNGVAAGGGSIAARPGSLDNQEPLRVGGYDATRNALNGVLGLLRLDMGRLLPDDYYPDEWDFLRFGLPRLDRGGQDFTGAWFFAQSLLDSSDQLLPLVWQGGDVPTYADGYPAAVAPVTYTFEVPCSYGDDPGYLPPPEAARAEDRTLRAAAWTAKRRLQLQFQSAPYSQWLACEGARLSGNDLAFYEEGNKPRTLLARITDLSIKSVPYFRNGQKLCDFDLVLEQV